MPRPTQPPKPRLLPPPKGGDWSTVVNATPAGGFMMGNPNAKVKLIEYRLAHLPALPRVR